MPKGGPPGLRCDATGRVIKTSRAVEERAVDRMSREGRLGCSVRTERAMSIVAGEGVGRCSGTRLRDLAGIVTFGATSGWSGLKARSKRGSCGLENTR